MTTQASTFAYFGNKVSSSTVATKSSNTAASKTSVATGFTTTSDVSQSSKITTGFSDALSKDEQGSGSNQGRLSHPIQRCCQPGLRSRGYVQRWIFRIGGGDFQPPRLARLIIDHARPPYRRSARFRVETRMLPKAQRCA